MGFFEKVRFKSDKVKSATNKSYKQIEKEKRARDELEAKKAEHASKLETRRLKAELKQFNQERKAERKAERKQKITNAKNKVKALGQGTKAFIKRDSKYLPNYKKLRRIK